MRKTYLSDAIRDIIEQRIKKTAKLKIYAGKVSREGLIEPIRTCKG